MTPLAASAPRRAASETAIVIAAVPGLAIALLADHRDDGHGRCPRCPIGAQAGRERWPCRIHTYAAAAADLLNTAAGRRDRPRR
jgi:hypothetical protein